MAPMCECISWRLSMNLGALASCRRNSFPELAGKMLALPATRFMVPMRGRQPWRLPMNQRCCGSQTRAPAGLEARKKIAQGKASLRATPWAPVQKVSKPWKGGTTTQHGIRMYGRRAHLGNSIPWISVTRRDRLSFALFRAWIHFGSLPRAALVSLRLP
jgi:hypothetical protein